MKLSDEIDAMKWAFADETRRYEIRFIANQVRAMEGELEKLRAGPIAPDPYRPGGVFHVPGASARELAAQPPPSPYEKSLHASVEELRRDVRVLERDNALLWRVIDALAADDAQPTAFAVLQERGDV